LDLLAVFQIISNLGNIELRVQSLGTDSGNVCLQGSSLGFQGSSLGLQGSSLGLQGLSLGLQGSSLGLQGVLLGLLGPPGRHFGHFSGLKIVKTMFLEVFLSILGLNCSKKRVSRAILTIKRP